MGYEELLRFLKTKITKGKNDIEKQLIVNEELQKITLFALNNSKEKKLYFLGGTNLRLCYGLDRYSEDLDFSYHGSNIDLEYLSGEIQKIFEGIGVKIQLKWNTNTNVKKTFIKIPNIYLDLGISKIKSESVSIKIEIDVNPPEEYLSGSKILQSFLGANVVRNYNLDTTFSGKIGAVLLRKYSKGRDYYDLLWYFQNIPSKFNLKFLQNTIVQYNSTSEKKLKIPQDHKEVMNMLLEKIENIDIGSLKDDIKRFSVLGDKVVDIYIENYKTELLHSMKQYLEKIKNDGNMFRL